MKLTEQSKTKLDLIRLEGLRKLILNKYDYEILNILGEDFINRIPKKMYNLIDEERDKDYIPNLLQENGLLDESKISQETIALFAVLNVKYFTDDENQKQDFMNKLKKNEEKYQAQLREKYNPDDIFKNKNSVITQNEQDRLNTENNKNLPIKVQKQSLLKKLLSFIKKLMHN